MFDILSFTNPGDANEYHKGVIKEKVNRQEVEINFRDVKGNIRL